MDFSMFIRKLLQLTVLLDSTEDLLSLVLVLSFTEVFISVFTIPSRLYYHQTFKITFLLTSLLDGVLQLELVWLHIQLIPSEEE
jgi:hypothetical protein